MAMSAVIDLAQVFSTFDEAWQPRTIAAVNDYDVRVVRTVGEFTPHRHPETDELFLVVSGELTIRVEASDGDSKDIIVAAGQLFVVPRGVKHQPFSEVGAEVLLLEPRQTVNTGDSPSVTTDAIRLV